MVILIIHSFVAENIFKPTPKFGESGKQIKKWKKKFMHKNSIYQSLFRFSIKTLANL